MGLKAFMDPQPLKGFTSIPISTRANVEPISSETIIKFQESILLLSTSIQTLGTTMLCKIHMKTSIYTHKVILFDVRLSNSVSGAHLVFVKNWMEEHMEDAEKVLNMPVVFGEFGVTSKDERFNSKFREAFMNTVYNTMLKSRERGGSAGGCLLWQLFPEGADHMDDGYAVILPKSPATSRMISLHNVKVKKWKFPWGPERSDSENPASHEEL